MGNEPQQIPPRKPTWFAYLFGIAGLLVLNGAADSLVHHKAGPTGWILLVSGVGLLVLAFWWAGRRGSGPA